MTTDDRDAFLQQILRKVFKAEDSKIIIKDNSKEFGGGFLAINSTVDVVSKNETKKLFVKTASTNEAVRQQTTIKDIFAREIYFYSTLHPEFLKFQEDLNVKQPFTNVAKCYFTSQENLEEIIVLEDLKEQGFVMYEKEAPMNEQHITHVFKLYAKFHAVSYVMKDKRPKLYRKLTENMNDLIGALAKSSGFDLALLHGCKNVKDSFDPVQDARVLNKIENLADLLLDTFVNGEEFVDEYSVITHGDCWRNNFLFKYKDLDDQNTPEDVKFVDWQLVRVSSPVSDLSYFFYCVATKPILANLEFYLKTYYDTLSETIAEMGSVANKLYPYRVFREHWRKFSKFGLATAFIILKLMLSEKKEVPDMNKVNDSTKVGDIFTYQIDREDLYKQRTKDLVEHFIDNHFL